MPRNRSVNVRDLGAVGDGIIDDTLAFQRAAALCTGRGDAIRVPPTTEGAFPGYLISANYLESLANVNDAFPGAVTELDGRIISRASIVLPGTHRIIGTGTDANSSTPSGPTILAAADFPNDGTPLVRLGRPHHGFGRPNATVDEAADGTSLEWLRVNGHDKDQIVAVYSTSIQERSGLSHCIVSNCNSGIIFAGGTGINPANYSIYRTDCWMNQGYTGYGMRLHGGAVEVSRCTVTAPDNVAPYTIGNVAFSLQGRGQHVHDCHAEYARYALEIGGDTNEYWIFNISVEQFTAFNPTQDATAETYLTVASPAGDNTLQVNSIANFANGDGIEIQLDNGRWHLTTVNGAPSGSIITITDAIPSGRTAAQYNAVHRIRTGNPAMEAIVHINNNMDHLWNVSINKLSCNLNRDGFADPKLIFDERNNVSLRMDPTHLTVNSYSFGGAFRRDSAVATPIAVDTDYHKGTRTVTWAAGALDDFDPCDADTFLVTPDAGGTSAVNSIIDGYLGRKIKFVNTAASGSGRDFTIVSAATTGTAAMRCIGAGYDDVVLAPGETGVLEYGISPIASRWSAWKLVDPTVSSSSAPAVDGYGRTINLNDFVSTYAAPGESIVFSNGTDIQQNINGSQYSEIDQAQRRINWSIFMEACLYATGGTGAANGRGWYSMGNNNNFDASPGSVFVPGPFWMEPWDTSGAGATVNYAPNHPWWTLPAYLTIWGNGKTIGGSDPTRNAPWGHYRSRFGPRIITVDNYCGWNPRGGPATVGGGKRDLSGWCVDGVAFARRGSTNGDVFTVQHYGTELSEFWNVKSMIVEMDGNLYSGNPNVQHGFVARAGLDSYVDDLLVVGANNTGWGLINSGPFTNDGHTTFSPGNTTVFYRKVNIQGSQAGAAFVSSGCFVDHLDIEGQITGTGPYVGTTHRLFLNQAQPAHIGVLWMEGCGVNGSGPDAAVAIGVDASSAMEGATVTVSNSYWSSVVIDQIFMSCANLTSGHANNPAYGIQIVVGQLCIPGSIFMDGFRTAGIRGDPAGGNNGSARLDFNSQHMIADDSAALVTASAGYAYFIDRAGGAGPW